MLRSEAKTKIRQNLITLLIVSFVLLLSGGCATLPRDFARPVSHAFTDTDSTFLANVRIEEKKAHPGKSGFLLLQNGLDAFVARIVLAEVAERSIDVQYYLYHNDLVGNLFTSQLLKAADRGIRIRLLVDDMNLEGRDLGVAAMDSHPNVEIRIFNPFSRKAGRIRQLITRMGSVTRRMHNKSFIVDNQSAILGGRNIGNEYFEADPDLNFSDLDVLALGQVVREASDAFDLYWNSELAYPASVLVETPAPEEVEKMRNILDTFIAEQREVSSYMKALRNSSLANRIRKGTVEYYWGEAAVLYDHPEKVLHDFDKVEYHLAPKLRPFAENTRNELIIISPYFVPRKKGVKFLEQLSKRGVRVRIVTNSLASNDVTIVHAGYSRYRKDLLRAGIELYELNHKLSREVRKKKKGKRGSSKASLHAKSFIFDRKQVFIGSLNLDPRALIHNTEIGLVLESTELAEWMAEWFDRNIDKIAFRLELQKDKKGVERLVWHGQEDGELLTFYNEPYTGFWRRFGVGFFRLFPIDSQL